MRKEQPADFRTSSGRQQGRSMIATVLFFDVVGYTKQSVSRQIELKDQFNSLISGLIGHVGEDQRIILDTGDGAAIGFLQHPEDALDVAMKFRAAVTANSHRDYPDLKVRAGIHLGPVNVMKDMNGQLNMVGDGINDAQRIMSFAGIDQIYVSRAYFDVISRLTADSARLFKYYGTQKDKHGREHQVYQVLGEGAGVPGRVAVPPAGGVESLLQDLSSMLQSEPQAPPPQPASKPAPSGEWKPMEIPGAPVDAQREQQAEAEKAAKASQAAAAKAAQLAEQEARVKAQMEAARAKAEEEAARARAAEEEAERQRQEEAARKLAADQAKAFAEAEKRARKVAEAEEKARQKQAKVLAKEEKKKAKLEAAAAAKAAKQKAAGQKAPGKAARPARVSRGFPLFKVIFVLLLLAVGAVVGLPNIYPMQEYIPRVEGEMSQVLGQPVHIGGIKVATVPVPKVDLLGVTVGKAQQLKIGRLSLFPNVLSLVTSRRKFDKVELNNVSIDADFFMAALPVLRAAGRSDKYPLVRMDLHGVRVTGGGPVPEFDGKIDFDQYGNYSKASLSAASGKYQVELMPKDKDRAQIEVDVENSALPLISAVEFSSLQITGEIGGDGATFSNVSGTLYGGSLKGVATLSWRNGWQLQGNVAVHSILMEKALPGMKISGDMEGNASFFTSGPALVQLAQGRRLDGAFTVREGQLDGLDIAETLRGDRRQAVSGTTHFDILTGTVHLDSDGEHLKPIRVTSGRMTISGSADASAEGQLSGHFTVDTSKLRAGLGSLALHLGGTVAAPEWSVGR